MSLFSNVFWLRNKVYIMKLNQSEVIRLIIYSVLIALDSTTKFDEGELLVIQ